MKRSTGDQMAVPQTTLWDRGPHTEGKHLVLEHYLNAWFPILGMGDWNSRILFVDGFAGPGEYTRGEEGSPVVAMRVLAEHSARRRINAEVVFHFIESEPERAEHLKALVAGWQPKLPPSAKVHVRKGTFDASMTDVLDYLEDHGKHLAPAFVMIDPFGVRGMPMEVIKGILANPMCEVYVSFMWESMNRFVSQPGFEAHLDTLFGTSEWREGRMLSGGDRKDFLHRLYQRQLKRAGAEQVVLFHLFKGDRLKYSIFFGTRHTLGSDRMKKAIWKVAPFGDFSFRGGTQDQMVLLGMAQPDPESLGSALQHHFGDAGWVTIEDVMNFVRSDKTIFHDSQVKRPVLKPMERAGRIDVDEKTRRMRGSYPKGCRINFRPKRLSLF